MNSWWKQVIQTVLKPPKETGAQPPEEREPETLRLPPAAGAFWEKIRDATAAELDAPSESGETRRAYEIGGGSILAARWGHRQSYDIDLTTTDPNGAIAETVSTNGGLASAINGVLSPQSTMHRAVISTSEGNP